MGALKRINKLSPLLILVVLGGCYLRSEPSVKEFFSSISTKKSKEHFIHNPKCQFCNLENQSLSGLVLKNRKAQGVNFFQANLQGSDFTGSDFISGEFSFANMVGTNFTDVNATRANFSFGYMFGAIINGMHGMGVDLSHVRGEKMSGMMVNLPHAQLYQSEFRNGNFKDAYMPYANFSNSYVEAVDFQGAYLMNSNFSNTKLNEVNFSNANLMGSVFLRASLNGANFTKADLSDTFFDAVDLSGATLTQSKNYDTVTICNSVMPDGGYLEGCIGPSDHNQLVRLLEGYEKVQAKMPKVGPAASSSSSSS